jgi:ribosome-binding protein aMBF1 (putative translation factor)
LKARATKKGNTVDRVLVRDTVASAPSRRSDTQGPAQERSPGGADVPATGVGFDEWLARKREKDAAETAPLPKKIRERHSVERAVERLVEEGEVRPEARELLVEHATKTKEKNVANDSMTLGDVAKLLGVHPSRISQLWNAGKLGKDREKEGGSWKYPRAVVEALKAERDGEAPAAKKTRRTAPPPTRKERPMREENPAEGSELLVVARKLRWLISGLADDLVQLDEVYTYAKSDDVDRVLS